MPFKLPQSRAGRWETFARRYEPLPGPEGNNLFPWDAPEVQSAKPEQVWTVVDCDGRLYVTAGLATVNYHARIVTRNPWPDAEQSAPGYLY